MPAPKELTPVRRDKLAMAADEVRAADGKWVMVGTRNLASSARHFVSAFKDGKNEHYQPASDYEVEYRVGEFDYELWVRKSA